MWKRLLPVLAVVLLAFPGFADAGVRIGIGLGFGIPIGPYPYYGGYPYYGPYAYPYAAPVMVQQPAVMMPAPTTYYQQAPATMAPAAISAPPAVIGSSSSPVAAPVYSPPPPVSSYSPAPVSTSGVVVSNYDQSAADAALQRLNQPDENARRDAVMDLGRMKADRAVDSVISVMNNDSSPLVRDAAARALGLIGSTRCLPALTRAALADNDRDVRHSAQFAIEVIRSQMRR